METYFIHILDQKNIQIGDICYHLNTSTEASVKVNNNDWQTFENQLWSTKIVFDRFFTVFGVQTLMLSLGDIGFCIVKK